MNERSERTASVCSCKQEDDVHGDMLLIVGQLICLKHLEGGDF